MPGSANVDKPLPELAPPSVSSDPQPNGMTDVDQIGHEVRWRHAYKPKTIVRPGAERQDPSSSADCYELAISPSSPSGQKRSSGSIRKQEVKASQRFASLSCSEASVKAFPSQSTANCQSIEDVAQERDLRVGKAAGVRTRAASFGDLAIMKSIRKPKSSVLKRQGSARSIEDAGSGGEEPTPSRDDRGTASKLRSVSVRSVDSKDRKHARRLASISSIMALRPDLDGPKTETAFHGDIVAISHGRTPSNRIDVRFPCVAGRSEEATTTTRKLSLSRPILSGVRPLTTSQTSQISSRMQQRVKNLQPKLAFFRDTSPSRSGPETDTPDSPTTQGGGGKPKKKSAFAALVSSKSKRRPPFAYQMPVSAASSDSSLEISCAGSHRLSRMQVVKRALGSSSDKNASAEA
ncbi:uncharacterized protein L969DRAFT_96269 [Mixia osmundae IAM 14324]|uniref:Uncharacterized protein n=1 Tax=Mixia osmundae (strain CBS 9802 / IAM 14324 / JCM 22182 / KY 12970) TaxID=764103 RepID=G7E4X9_MIXOS|nr:uncharacterized protein L969DRAFT_96269 [Mixia osmundae IAM 14324]KEI37751.1 hypothetical protein L969DRAFT_96269 [Mixia osmundae IAM 14324]GAA97889.1 hypothetical protein E5Q_04569 [Mixia osmundae IAM 14324]